jgi:rhodanese-related sulfurtransferase
MRLFNRLFGPKVRQISVREAYELLQTADPPLLVDVRQPVETQAETIPGAVLIPLTEFGRRYRELPRDRQILTICRSSHRSPIAARRLARAGYDVLDVAGGLNVWQRTGLPVEKNGQGA